MISAALALALAAAQPAHGAAEESFARRIFVLQADESCDLLTDDQRAALNATANQARGALERAGVQTGELEGRVRYAAKARACTDPFLETLAAEARNAYAGWAAMRAMDFPGQRRTWTVRRVLEPDAMPRWALWQTLDGGVRFGLGVTTDKPLAMLAIPAASAQGSLHSARLEMRDPDKMAQPFDPALGGLLRLHESANEMSGYTTPERLSKLIWASGEQPAEGEQAPAPGRGYDIIYFPASAFTAMSRLDPRETVRVRVRRDDGETLHYIEAGDIAAALAFLHARPAAS